MSGQKFGYTIVENRTREVFERLVVELLRAGWALAGGVSTTAYEYESRHGFKDVGLWYSQAMMREPEAKVKITGPEETSIDIERIEKAFREHGFIKDAG